LRTSTFPKDPALPGRSGRPWTAASGAVHPGRRLSSLPSRLQRLLLRLIWLLPLTAVAALPAAPASEVDPTQVWRVDFESGVLWHFAGSASPLDYVFLPQILSLIGPANFHRPFLGGEIFLRSRYSVILDPIVQAPEHHYFAASASGLLEWWDLARTRCLFFTSGGGCGWLDAKGYEIAGGQGQEFNFNWLIYGGARFRVAPRWTASLGLYFQHVSNGHLDKLDPGVNALGPMLNASWRF